MAQSYDRQITAFACTTNSRREAQILFQIHCAPNSSIYVTLEEPPLRGKTKLVSDCRVEAKGYWNGMVEFTDLKPGAIYKALFWSDSKCTVPIATATGNPFYVRAFNAAQPNYIQDLPETGDGALR